jgi:hypothetical protein
VITARPPLAIVTIVTASRGHARRATGRPTATRSRALAFDPADGSRFVVAGEDGLNQNALSALSVWQLR